MVKKVGIYKNLRKDLFYYPQLNNCNKTFVLTPHTEKVKLNSKNKYKMLPYE